MSLRKLLSQLFLFAVLEMGAIGGVPMPPEKIQEIMQMMNRARAVFVVKKSGDGLPPLD